MGKTFRPWDVDQTWLFPPSVKDLVPPDHLSHFVRDLVREELDLSAIFEDYTEMRGFPPYHPAMMTALPLYAYSRGVYSSRRIERSCEERLRTADRVDAEEDAGRHECAGASLELRPPDRCRIEGNRRGDSVS